ncbi:aspartic peptidase A1 [Crassisporium funariophilum]|nr:aspartic peptidase A1 [Crassisporium funariophilum]
MLSLQFVDSLPLKRESKLVTLPLKRAEQESNVHPQIKLQQHINRSIRRLARMTGREAPSARSLEQGLQKRVLAVEGQQGLERRFNRMGVPTARNSKLEKRFNRYGVPKANAASGSSLISLKKGKKGAASVPDVTPADAPSDGDSLGLDIEAQDVGYLATVQIGTPPQDFKILMDSGSADFWVGSEDCQSEDGGGCGNHNFLGTTSSSSFQNSSDTFQVTYGTGEVSGNIIQDDITVAGLALKGHTFGVATLESVDFSADTTPFDGLMGLAQSTLSEQQTATPVEALAKAGLIPDSITSFKISRLADNKNDGEITFGGLDTSKFDQQTLITVPNVNKDGFWEADLDAATVDGTDTGLTGRTAILDTGTTLMVVPAADAAVLHQNIEGAKSDGQGGFTVPCTTTASIALTFGGQSFAIDPRDIAFQPVDATDPTGDCVSGIASGDIGGATEWLVGDVFLKNAYFSTDVSKNTVSLAKLV